MRAPAPSAREVQRALAEVLARPEFAYEPPSGFVLWLGRVRQALIDAIALLFARLRLPAGAETAVVWTLRVLLAVLAILLVARIIAAVRPSGSPRIGARGGSSPSARAGAAADWLREAEAAMERGQVREAVIALYKLLLERLQRRGALRLDRSKTPGDYRRELRPHPSLAGEFESFLRAFEPIAFGPRVPEPADFDRLKSLARAVADE